MLAILERAWEDAIYIASKNSQANSDGPLNLHMWHVSRLSALVQRLPDDKRESSNGLHSHFSPDDEIDTILLRQALADLASFSIVRIHETTRNLTMHPLAHAWARDHLKLSESNEAKVSAGCILALSLQGRFGYNPFWLQLQPHVESCLNAWPLEPSVVPFKVVQYLYALAYLLNDLQSRLPEVERVWMFLSEHESLKLRPEADIDVSCSLAHCYFESDKVIEAEAILEDKIRTYEAIFEPGHARLCGLLYQLGGAYRRLGRCEKAIQYFEELLQYYGPQDIGGLSVKHELGQLYTEIGEADKGIRLLKEVIHADESTFEPEDPSRLPSQDALAKAYISAGKFDEGILILQDVAQIRQRTYRADNVNRLASELELSRTYIDVGESANGIQLLEGVVRVLNTTVQLGKSIRLRLLDQIANAYLSIGERDRVIPILEEWSHLARMIQSY